MVLYVFDMDGTLTPARLPMTAEFASIFSKWQKTHSSFIATGSDMKKVKEQLPIKVMNAFTGIYASMGNILWANGRTVYEKQFSPLKTLLECLEKYRLTTTYSGALFPNYIEKRTGMINFSVLGRNCPYAEREKYYAWDKVAGERTKIRDELLQLFPEYDVSIGGSISIDITPKGCGKGQIAKHLRESYPDEKIIFLGDKTFKGGNDYDLAYALTLLPNTQIIQVSGPNEVLDFLGNKNG